ncbi:MAG: hypothetical protein IPM98_07120 [Lewinellaceae bacterium]|nr:hypothetical protein [Lewinellaceae bacterium]
MTTDKPSHPYVEFKRVCRPELIRAYIDPGKYIFIKVVFETQPLLKGWRGFFKLGLCNDVAQCSDDRQPVDGCFATNENGKPQFVLKRNGAFARFETWRVPAGHACRRK